MRDNNNLLVISIYHMRHFCLGFILDPSGHWKVLANSGLFTTVPFTLHNYNNKYYYCYYYA